MTKLSICIPTFNRVNLLIRCVNSIAGQMDTAGHPDIEIVISDNASSDGTEEACRMLCQQYPGLILYFRQAKTIQAENNF